MKTPIVARKERGDAPKPNFGPVDAVVGNGGEIWGNGGDELVSE